MGLFSGNTAFSVREAIQPRQTVQILSSGKLLSGTTTTEIYDTRRYKNCQIYGNISQLSGTAGITLNYSLDGSVYNDANWWGMGSGASRTTVGRWNDKLPGGTTWESSGILNNYSRFNIFSNASSDGGIWTQMDVVFVK